MSKVNRLGKWGSWVVVLVLGLAQAVQAESPKPVLVLSVASYQKVVEDLGMLGKLADRPEIGTALEGMISLATGGKGLAGLDKDRPICLVVQTDGQLFTPYLLIPVTQLEKLIGVVEPLLPRPVVKKDGVYELSFEGGRKLYLQSKGQQWAVGTEKAEALASVPEEIPAEVQQKLPAHWTVSVSVLAKNIAPEQRRQWAEQLRQQSQRELLPRPGETEEDFKIRKWLSEWVLDWAASILDQVEQVQIGLGVDKQAEAVVLELAAQPVSGSALAEAIQKGGETKTAFGGLRMPEATLTAHGVVRYPAGEFHQIAPLVQMLKVRALQQPARSNQTPEQAQWQRELTTAIFDLVEKTLTSGRAEGALSVVLQPDRFTLLAGAYVADGQAVEKLLERAVAEARKVRPNEVDQYVKLRAAEVQGVHLHVVRFPIPMEAERRESLIQLIGSEVELVIGTGAQVVYVGLGKEAEAALRQAIQTDTQGPQAAAPVEVNLAIKPVLALLAEHGDSGQREKARSLLEKVSGKDRLRLVTGSSEGRLRLRVEIQQDVLAVMAAATGMQE